MGDMADYILTGEEDTPIGRCIYCDDDVFDDQEYRSSNCGDYYYHLGCGE